ncbi:Panacea domain-containing protein [Xanthobacter sp. TB0136]|uniref:Panacea domain-containing protein n=1 Tax=Xanthobacter sp. TB0136 TaxID=3459177 RepID=UPI004039B532
MYDARQVANWFVERAKEDGRSLTIMQLLKLVYIAHGWYLEMSKSPLIRNRIEAWQYGPVIPDVYEGFRPKGIKVEEPVDGYEIPRNAFVDRVLNHVYDTYGKMTASRLSTLTHEVGGPWHKATSTYGYFAPITDDMILPHYQEKRRQYNERQETNKAVM